MPAGKIFVAEKGRKQKGRSLYRKPRSVTALNKKVNRLFNASKPELKYYDTEIADGTPLDAPLGVPTVQMIEPLGMTQGDGITNRDGDRIKLKQLYIRGAITYATAALDKPLSFVRLMLVKVIDNVASASNYTDQILTDLADYNTLYKYPLDRKQKFKIMYDKRYLFKQGAADDVRDTIKTFVINRRFKTPVNVQFTTGGSTIQRNRIYLLCFTNEPQDVYSWGVQTRCTFTD